MLRDNFKKKLAEKQKVSGGFRSVVGTGAWQKLKETAAESVGRVTPKQNITFISLAIFPRFNYG